MTKEKFNDVFETNEEIKSELACSVKMYVYDDTRESNVNGKWQHSDPRKRWFDIGDIHYFREQTENDKYNSNCLWVSDGTVMPTKWCMMVYFDNYVHSIKIIPVVGTAKDLNRHLESVKNTYYERRNRLYKLHDKIKDLYLTEEI